MSAFPTERRSYPVNPVLAMCMQPASRLPKVTKQGQRNGTPYALYPKHTRPSLDQSGSGSDQPRRVHTHTRIHTQTMPCHAIQTIHTTQSITVNPSRPFLARPDRPHSCSRLAAAATAQTDRQTTSSNGKPPARTARHVKNLISLAPSVSSLFISSCPNSPSLFPFLGPGDASPVFYFALLSKPYRQAGGQSVSQSISQSVRPFCE